MTKPVRKHVKMYADDKFIEALQAAAEKEGLNQSSFLFLAAKDKIKKVNK
ncbi:MAG: hypothetical protein V3R25_06050 [Nitrosomonadaceae bacterium]